MMNEFFGRRPTNMSFTDPRFGGMIRKAWKVSVGDSAPTGSTQLSDGAFGETIKNKKGRLLAKAFKKTLLYNVVENDGESIESEPFADEDTDKYVKALKLEVGQRFILPDAHAVDTPIDSAVLSEKIKLERDTTLDDHVSHELIKYNLADYGTIMDSFVENADVYFSYVDESTNTKYISFSSLIDTMNELVPDCDNRGPGCTLCMDTTDHDERKQCRVTMNHKLGIPSHAGNTYFENCVDGYDGELSNVVVSPRYSYLYHSLLGDPTGLELILKGKNTKADLVRMKMNIKVSTNKLVSYNDIDKDDKSNDDKLALYQYDAGIGHGTELNDYGACIQPSTLDAVTMGDEIYDTMQKCMDADNKLRIFLFSPFTVSVGIFWFIYFGIFLVFIGILMDNLKILNSENTKDGFILRHATIPYGDIITKDLQGKPREWVLQDTTQGSTPVEKRGVWLLARFFDFMHYFLTWGFFFTAFVYILILQLDVGDQCDRQVIPYSSEGKVAQDHLGVVITTFLAIDGFYLAVYMGLTMLVMIKPGKTPDPLFAGKFNPGSLYTAMPQQA